jgi:putative Mn2+ efflux pump MntP
LQALATSIDALAVGVTLQMAALSPAGLALGAWGATGVIGVITLGLSVGAVYIGKAIGDKLADKAGLFGGVVLVAIGLKILIESFI